MTQTIRLTAAQAMVKWLSVQFNEDGDRYIDGVWGIFGHGNVAGLGEPSTMRPTLCRRGVDKTNRRWRIPLLHMRKRSSANVRRL